MLRKILLTIPLGLLLVGCGPRYSGKDKFIDDLMSRMTLEEKIGQLNMIAVSSDIVTGPEVKADVAQLLKNNALGSVLNIRGAEKVRSLQKYAVDSSSLHIPLLFGLDIIHGYGVQMPVPLGLASSWNPMLAEKTARISAETASADGICWTFSPMLDICHDARWGRIVEGNGEDPYLGSRFAEAYVRGYQGDKTWSPDQIMACVKHFALYGGPFGGLDYTAVDMSRSFAWNYYMAPYKAAVDAGAETVMTSFNDFEGVPGTANKYLLEEVLREQLGFEGIVVSDYNAVGELREHGLGDGAQAASMAIGAGLDIEMCSGLFLEELPELVKEGRVSEKAIDTACRRVLETKRKLGLFDDPYRYCRPEDKNAVYNSRASREESCRIAEECIVLLKNDNDILPLRKDARIALVGPFADEIVNMDGPWTMKGLEPVEAVSLLDGLENISNGKIFPEAGCDICYDEGLQKHLCWYKPVKRLNGNPGKHIGEALEAARKADVIVAAMGEPACASGEGASRTDISIPDAQKDLLKRLVATGKPVVLVLFNGRPLDLSWESKNLAAILDVWFPGTEGGNAIARVLYGEVNPSGKLPVSFPRNVGQEPYFYNHPRFARSVPEGNLQRNRVRYLDSEISPLYPFGFGLSYTSFEYAEPAVRVEEGNVIISIDVRNSGTREGKEVVQLYIRDVVASETRPVQELKGFRKLALSAGETRTVEFTLTKRDLSFYDKDVNSVFEPGEFIAMVGGNCRDVKTVKFEM